MRVKPFFCVLSSEEAHKVVQIRPEQLPLQLINACLRLKLSQAGWWTSRAQWLGLNLAPRGPTGLIGARAAALCAHVLSEVGQQRQQPLPRRYGLMWTHIKVAWPSKRCARALDVPPPRTVPAPCGRSSVATVTGAAGEVEGRVEKEVKRPGLACCFHVVRRRGGGRIMFGNGVLKSSIKWLND